MRRGVAVAIAAAAASAFALELRVAVECDAPGAVRTTLFFLPALLAGGAGVAVADRSRAAIAPAIAIVPLAGTWVAAALVYLNYAGCD